VKNTQFPLPPVRVLPVKRALPMVLDGCEKTSLLLIEVFLFCCVCPEPVLANVRFWDRTARDKKAISDLKRHVKFIEEAVGDAHARDATSHYAGAPTYSTRRTIPGQRIN
jgi:hypothetical protein